MRTGQRRLREASRALQSSRPRRPIAIATALDDHRGVRRGFLPRGLCNTCPDATRTRDYLRAWAGVAQALTGVPARGPRKLPVAGHPRRGRLASPARSPTYGRFRGTAAGRLHRRRMTGSGGSCRSTAKPERQHPVLRRHVASRHRNSDHDGGASSPVSLGCHRGMAACLRRRLAPLRRVVTACGANNYMVASNAFAACAS